VSEANRMEFLFELYEKYTADLFTKESWQEEESEGVRIIAQLIFSLYIQDFFAILSFV
jgi:hypothetical protein